MPPGTDAPLEAVEVEVIEVVAIPAADPIGGLAWLSLSLPHVSTSDSDICVGGSAAVVNGEWLSIEREAARRESGKSPFGGDPVPTCDDDNGEDNEWSAPLLDEFALLLMMAAVLVPADIAVREVEWKDEPDKNAERQWVGRSMMCKDDPVRGLIDFAFESGSSSVTGSRDSAPNREAPKD